MTELLTAQEIQRKALLDAIKDLLNQCSAKQNVLFEQLNFKNGSIENETLENIIVAYNLCRRTVISNRMMMHTENKQIFNENSCENDMFTSENPITRNEIEKLVHACYGHPGWVEPIRNLLLEVPKRGVGP